MHAGVDLVCSEVSGNFCATLYERADCGGWALNVGSGYTELPREKKNEAETVVLKAGCNMIGYDKPVGWQGARSTKFEAADGLVWKLKSNQLRHGIEAVSCYC